MGFGFPAFHSTQVELVGSRQNVCDAIEGTFEVLSWNFERTGPDTFTAKIAMSAISWGETVTVSLSESGLASVHSVCRNPFQLFDWGQNKRNVEQFTAISSARQIREAKFEHKEPVYVDEQGNSPLDRLIRDDESMEFDKNNTRSPGD